MKHIILILITILVLSSCIKILDEDTNTKPVEINTNIIKKYIQNNSIKGIWYGIDNIGDTLYLGFNEDNTFEIHNEYGIKQNDDIEGGSMKYETIDSLDPKQLYIILKLNDQQVRKPFGIYKIEGDNLIIRDAIEYHKSLGGFDMGVSRYEMPKDFNGVITNYKRVDKVIIKKK